MIQRKPANRLGANGIQEVKQHAWLKGFDWVRLYEKTIEPPFIPPNLENFADRRQLSNDPWLAANGDAIKQNTLLLRQNSVQSLFNGYYFELEKQRAAENSTTQQFSGLKLD